MQTARVFDSVDSAGVPAVLPERQGFKDDHEKDGVLAFLNSGKILQRVTVRDVDRLDATRGQVVPLSLRSDGEWIWSSALNYYAANYGIVPEAEFLEHMAHSGYQPAIPDGKQIQAVLSYLRREAEAHQATQSEQL